jgi:hypothetical protein
MPFERNSLAHRVIERRGIGFQAMRKRIHAGTHRDDLRHADGEFRIADRHCRKQFRMEDDLLDVGDRIGQHAGATDFRPRTSRRRHRDDRRYGVGIGAGPPVTDILEIPDRPALPGLECDQLAKIKPGPAAKGDDPVMPAGLEDGNAGFKVCLVRVGIDFRKHCPAKTGGLQKIECIDRDRQRGKPPVGDQKRPLHARSRAGFGKFRNTASTKTDCCGIGPVGARAHADFFLRW